MKIKISIIVAMARNHVIGSKNAMPWHIPGELPRFKRITTGHPIIMGRKTYESIGKPLPDRLNIVITRDLDFKIGGAVVVHSLDEAIGEGKKFYESRVKNQESRKENENISHDSKFLLHDSDENEVFIIGGGQIFQEAMGMADKLYLTLIDKDFAGDTYFPEYEKIFTKEIAREDHNTEEYKFSFLELEK